MGAGWRAVLVAVAGAMSVVVGSSAPAAAQPSAFCAPGQTPRFVFGVAALAERLGPLMGAPLECEHVDPSSGQTLQRTSTGLAAYQPATNSVTFTDGAASYVLADGQILFWRGSGDIPPVTPTEAAYLAATAAFRDRLDGMKAQLQAIHEAALAGGIDEVASANISALATDFFAARQAFAASRPSVRLDRYDQTIKVSLAQAYDATDLFLRARLSDSSAERDGFIQKGSVLAASSLKLYERARAELSALVPVVLQ